MESKFYCDLAHQYGSPVLDIACGTGRMTIPLAERGYDMTGFDITPEMLEAAKQKALDRGVSVHWIQADMRQLELGRKYMPSSSFRYKSSRASYTSP
ncbi:class I SAM-dependent methyltransferase [Paenactinomyces guangxiensis]|nr:class I SAM-dependent methyltransferase [Paenactinomyces guangxiensis]